MLKPSDAYKRFKRKYPRLIVQRMTEYNGEYIIAAVSKEGKTDYDDPYWSVSKRDGVLNVYRPGPDFPKFIRHMMENPIDKEVYVVDNN